MIGAGGAIDTIKAVVNGIVLSTTTSSGGSTDAYSFTLAVNAIPSGNSLLVYLLTGGTAGTVWLSDGNNLSNVNLTLNTLTVGSNSTAAVSNANISAAKGSLTSTDIPYSVSGNNISVNLGVAFQTANNTNYTLNGNISTQSANLTLTLSLIHI